MGDLAPPLIPTCVLTGKPEMRGGGQRTQPLGIRREARLSPSQTFSITSSRVSRARFGNCFSRSSSPSMFHWVPFWTVTLRLHWLLSTSVREIDPLGLPSPSAFSWSDGTQPSIKEGNGSRTQEKTRRYGQQTIKKGMQSCRGGFWQASSGMMLRAGCTSSIGCFHEDVVPPQAAQR